MHVILDILIQAVHFMVGVLMRTQKPKIERKKKTINFGFTWFSFYENRLVQFGLQFSFMQLNQTKENQNDTITLCILFFFVLIDRFQIIVASMKFFRSVYFFYLLFRLIYCSYVFLMFYLYFKVNLLLMGPWKEQMVFFYMQKMCLTKNQLD